MAADTEGPGVEQRVGWTGALAGVVDRARRGRRSSQLGALVASLAVFAVGLLAGSTFEVRQEVTSVDRLQASTTTTSPPPTTTSTSRRRPPPTTTPTTVQELPVAPDAGEDLTASPAGPAARASTGAGTAARRRVSPDVVRTASRPTSVASEPARSCRNSVDPACGPFHFDPPPVDEPMRVEVTVSPEEPEPDDEVTFTVRVEDDGPARPDDCVNTQTYGERDEEVGVCSADCPPSEPRYGHWDPPPPERTSFEEKFRHTYREAGTYTATFRYNEGADCSSSPYRSRGEASVTVTVDD